MYDLDFREFLEARGPVGGAFGKTGRPPQRYNVGNQGPINSAGNYQSRIIAGKGIEEQIRARMADELGIISTPSTSNQDKHLGIDAWIVSTDGGKTKTSIPLQIKARKNASGNDILWEAVKPWNKNLTSNFEQVGDQAFTGKDMKSQAKYLVSVSNDGGIIRMRSVPETINKAKEMVKEFIMNYRATGRTFAATQWGQARLVKDPSQEANYHMKGDVFKINCFIKPEAYEWKKDFRLQQPIGAV